MTALVALVAILTQPTRDIETAVALWKAAEMPIPPASAVPLFSGEPVIGLAEPTNPGEYTLYSGGYVYRQNRGDISSDTMCWEDFALKAKTVHYADSMQRDRFEEVGLVVLAIQAAALGHLDVTKAIITRPRFREFGSAGWLGDAANGSLTAMCAMAIYIHSANELTDPGSDRNKIIKVLEMISKRRLIATSKDFMRSPSGIENFIRCLKLANTPSHAKPGTLQAAIDDLVNVRINAIGFYSNKDHDPISKRVIGFGLDAVPILAELLTSKKLTRSFLPGMNRRPSQILSVNSIADEILLTIIAGELGTDPQLKKERVLKWYEAKRAGKVEEFLMASLFRNSDGSTYCDGDTFSAIGNSYPHLMRRAYEKVREAGVNDWIALNAIESSRLSKDEQLNLMVFAANGGDLDRLSTAQFLHKLDRDEYNQLLLRHFAKIPKSFDDNYAHIVNYALGTENSSVWDLVAQKIREAEIEMKMALLASLSDTRSAIRPIYRKRAVALLRTYFDNASKPTSWRTNLKLRESVQILDRDTPTVGHVALKAAAFASGILYTNVPAQISVTEWKAIRKKIEAGTIIERD